MRCLTIDNIKKLQEVYKLPEEAKFYLSESMPLPAIPKASRGENFVRIPIWEEEKYKLEGVVYYKAVYINFEW